MHSRDRITSSTMIPPPSIHPEGKLVLQAMKFRFDPRFIALSLFCRKPGVRCLGEKENVYIYIYVCIILDTFRWCFNFPINACLNRASRDLANLYFTRFARIKFYSFYITFDVCLFPI